MRKVCSGHQGWTQGRKGKRGPKSVSETFSIKDAPDAQLDTKNTTEDESITIPSEPPTEQEKSESQERFAAEHVSNGKSDHSNNPSFKSCLVRIPGSHNFKCVQANNNGVADSSTEVKVIKQWNGVRPKINPLLYDFYIWLADRKLKEISKSSSFNKKNNTTANHRLLGLNTCYRYQLKTTENM
jgi:hypothetical protein